MTLDRTTSVEVSPYALQHPDHYTLRPTCWQDGENLTVELVLMDAQDKPIDEDGCNCDMNTPCNNPTCVMEREAYCWY